MTDGLIWQMMFELRVDFNLQFPFANTYTHTHYYTNSLVFHFATSSRNDWIKVTRWEKMHAKRRATRCICISLFVVLIYLNGFLYTERRAVNGSPTCDYTEGDSTKKNSKSTTYPVDIFSCSITTVKSTTSLMRRQVQTLSLFALDMQYFYC